jgi:starch phosphorylase
MAKAPKAKPKTLKKSATLVAKKSAPLVAKKRAKAPAPKSAMKSVSKSAEKGTTRKYAYFSMEIAIRTSLPTYSGGLGVLAGDTIRSGADLGLPMVAMTLLYRKGYFKQVLDEQGRQSEKPVSWTPEKLLKPLAPKVHVEIAGRKIAIKAWQYDVQGVNGHVVPVYFLDTDLKENAPEDRELTHSLYSGDERHRLAQEIVLGIGGVRMLKALGHSDLARYHMNEGHAALLVLALSEGQTKLNKETVRAKCVFTTHTPVPAGHDCFGPELAEELLGKKLYALAKTWTGEKILHMTHLALNASNYTNGVAMRHGEVSREMFPKFDIKAITNGVHHREWCAKPMMKLFDTKVQGWREDANYLRDVLRLDAAEVWAAHLEAKKDLFAFLKKRTGVELDPEVFTIGFARRATPYKRGLLVFSDLERLTRIVETVGPVQMVFAGKAHPRDMGGKEIIAQIFAAAEKLKDKLKVVFVDNYDMEAGHMITSGVDVWLNTPRPPLEASGTSGMKASLNGVPSLSTRDGWWLEGHIEGVTGWAIGDENVKAFASDEEMDKAHAESLYDKLEYAIVPMYYTNPAEFQDVAKNAIAMNAPFFSTQRMVEQYARLAYR